MLETFFKFAEIQFLLSTTITSINDWLTDTRA